MKIDKKLVDKAYKIIFSRAEKYDPIYYGDLYNVIGLDHTDPRDRQIGRHLLGLVNEIKGKDYLLTSFAVSKAGNGPYQGYYTLAEELGRIKPGLSEKQKEDFWIEEMKRVYNKFRKNN